jgi:hypothetical protein
MRKILFETQMRLIPDVPPPPEVLVLVIAGIALSAAALPTGSAVVRSAVVFQADGQVLDRVAPAARRYALCRVDRDPGRARQAVAPRR